MIFLTVGSHEPFDRLVQGVDTWCGMRGNGEDVFAQITERAQYKPKHFRFVAGLKPTEFSTTFSEATSIISHAGMGTIINALSARKPIAIMPRRGHLHETRNDHQYATVQQLRNRPGLLIADDETELPATLDTLLITQSSGSRLPKYADEAFLSVIRDFIHDRNT